MPKCEGFFYTSDEAWNHASLYQFFNLLHKADRGCSTTKREMQSCYVAWDLLTHTSSHNRMSTILVSKKWQESKVIMRQGRTWRKLQITLQNSSHDIALAATGSNSCVNQTSGSGVSRSRTSQKEILLLLDDEGEWKETREEGGSKY